MRKQYMEQKLDSAFTALVLFGKLTNYSLDIGQAARAQVETL